MENDRVKLTVDENLDKFLKKTYELVNQLPDWKKGVLEASSRATNPTPRMPVIDRRVSALPKDRKSQD